MRLRWVAAVGIGVFLISTGMAAQQFWEKKNYTQWSKDECTRVLQSSPWVARHDIITTVSSPREGYGATDGNSTDEINYTFQLRSALPVRQALVRIAQLNNKYDKMNPEQKKTFDAQVNSYLQLDTTDLVFVHVLYRSNVSTTSRTLSQFWQMQTLDTLKDSVHLITPRGQRISPIKYEVAKGGELEFALIFPRSVDGEPLIAPADKTLGLEMLLTKAATQTTTAPAPVRRGSSGQVAQSFEGDRIFVEFKVPKMMYRGQLLY